jgi:hypothetical protein
MLDFLFNPGLLYASVLASTIAWATIVYMNWGRLAEDGPKALFAFLAGIHVFRFIGLAALLPQAIDPATFGFSQTYLMQVGFGDFIAGILATIAIIATLRDWSSASILRWAFVIIGTLDTLNAGPNFIVKITDQTQVGALGWLILTVYVPVIVVTEIVLIGWLLRKPFASAATTMKPAMA